MTFGPALLFCPGDRPDRYTKAVAAADAVILDLEDAVGPEHKDAARNALRRTPLHPDRTIVRVNAVGTDDFASDLAALARTDYRWVMLAKTEGPEQLDLLHGFAVIALCESPLGIERAGEIAAHPDVAALMWGAEDLLAGLGGRTSRRADGRYRDYARYARSRVLIAGGSAGKAVIDAVHLDIADEDGLRDEALDAAASGFAGTACIHPRQVPIVRAAFRPTEAELEWAGAVLAAAGDADGVFAFRGRMVDGPVLQQARRLVEAAAAA